MAKRKNSSRHGHSGDPRKRAADEQARAQAEATPELEDEVGAALEAGHPIDIVMLASSLIAGLDPDVRSPDDGRTDRLPRPEEFVRMFLDSSDPRLHVLAWTVARLLPDARLHHEVDAAVAPGVVPAWLLPLADAVVVGAWQTTDPLRDSTDIVVSLRVGEFDLSVIGLVDFNSEGALKDGFVVPAPLTAVQEALSASGETGMEAWDLPPPTRGPGSPTRSASVGPPSRRSSPTAGRRPVRWWSGLFGSARPGARAGCAGSGASRTSRSWSPSSRPLRRVRWSPTERRGPCSSTRSTASPATRPRTRSCSSAVRIEVGLGYLWPTTLHHDLDPLLGLARSVGSVRPLGPRLARGSRPTTPTRPWPRSRTSGPLTYVMSRRPTRTTGSTDPDGWRQPPDLPRTTGTGRARLPSCPCD